MKWFLKHIYTVTLSLVLAAFSLTVVMPALVSADATSKAAACQGLQQLNSTETCGAGAGTSTVNEIVKLVVNILSWVVGIIAIIMVIISGFKYVTSSGDSGSISSAKTTLIYALVGVIIVALAQFLVHYAIRQGNSAVTCTSPQASQCASP